MAVDHILYSFGFGELETGCVKHRCKLWRSVRKAYVNRSEKTANLNFCNGIELVEVITFSVT